VGVKVGAVGAIVIVGRDVGAAVGPGVVVGDADGAFVAGSSVENSSQHVSSNVADNSMQSRKSEIYLDMS